MGGHVIRIKNQGIYSKKRRMSANNRKTGDDSFLLTKDPNIIECPSCGCRMEFWKEDSYGDLIYSCTNQYCWKSKDWAGSITTELKKLAKWQQTYSDKYYRNYIGGYYPGRRVA